MDGNSPIGEDKSDIVTPNNGSIWSNSLTSSSGFRSSEPKTNAFDGNTSSICSAVGSGTITFTSPVTFASDSTIRVFLHGGDHTVTVNGGSNQTISAGSFQTVTYSNSGNANFVMTFHRGGGADTGVRAIEIDNHILVDGQIGNNWTPVNFGGSVELDKATGALPILNTTQGGTAAGVGVFGSKENKYYTVTVASVDGGNRYHFDGVDRPNPTLIRGATYTFDQSDSSNGTGGTHPLRFATAADAAGSSQYTDGVVTNGTPGQAGAYTKITVPHNAPDTLYYYCTNHGGMGSSTSQTTDETKADPYAWKCILAVPGVGGDYTDKSAQINCTSTTKASSAGGNPSSDGSSNFYNSSIDLDGNDKVTYTRTNAGDFSGQSDFTIEAWFNTDTTGATDAALFSNWDSGNNRSILFGPNASGGGKFTFIFNTTGSGSWTTVANPTAIAGKWMHVAWVYDHSATTHYAYINGVLQGSATGTAYNNSTANFLLGVNKGDGSGYYNGKVQDLRYYHAVKYTSDFVVPSTSPDVLSDTPSGVSGSSKLTKITDGSFNNPVTGGISKFGNISVADSADLEFGSGDFTLEAFIYYVGNPGTGNDTYAILSKWNNVSAPFDKGFILRISDDGSGDNLQWFYTTDGSTNLYTTGSTVLSPNTWYHIAFVRNGTTGTFYIDGVADSTTVSFGSNSIRNTGNAFRIGANLDGEEPDQEFKGFISNVRVVKGDAVYTGNFTPPSEPLTNITNTKILACQDNDYNVVGYTTTTANGASPIFNTTGDYGETYGDGNLNADPNASNLVLCCDFYANATDRMPTGRPSNQKSLSAGGNPNPGNATTSHFYGKSAHFDGNDQYSISSSADFSFDGEFCIELWANASSWGPFFVSGGTNGIWLGSTANGLVIRRYGVQNDLLVQVPPYNEWVHLAFTRDDSNILRIFINGEEQGIASVNFTYSQNTLYIGSDGAGGNYIGYIQDLRVYKGTAKYTSDFNPPFRSLNRVKAAVSPSQFRHTWYAGGPVNFNPFITDINTVRGQETGYCTWNPLAVQQSGHGGFRDGNLEIIASTDGSGKSTLATFPIPSTGKWYWEVQAYRTGAINNGGGAVGVAEASAISATAASGTRLGEANSSSWVLALNIFDARHRNTVDYSNYLNGGTAVTDTGIIGIAVDMDNDKMWMHYNGVYGNAGGDGNPVTGANPMFSGEFSGLEIFPAGGIAVDSGSGYIRANFGQKPFKFPPPDGFQPLNGTNLIPETVIARPDQYVGVTTYLGSSGNVVVDDLNHKPDAVIIKQDNAGGGTNDWVMVDSVRGRAKSLYPSATYSENTSAADKDLISFDRNGFTVGQTNQSAVNRGSSSYVYLAFAWKAGGGTGAGGEFWIDDVQYASAAAAGLNGGDMTPTGASVGTKQGFSILNFTAPADSGTKTISHGLSQTPEFYIFKETNRSSTAWYIFHHSVCNTNAKFFRFDDTALQSGAGNVWGNLPTSSLISIQNGSLNAASSQNILYAWHSVPGLQKFGKFSANANADGPFVELGFRPAFVWVKASDGADNWAVSDQERAKFNPSDKHIRLNAPDAAVNDSGNYKIDYLSNGFKIRGTNGEYNATAGNDYVYMAWAEAPTFNLYGGQSNAR